MQHIPRQIQDIIFNRIKENKVILLYGTRRVGKTKLLEAIRDKYNSPCLFLNAEDIEVQALLERRTFANYKGIVGDYKLIMIDEAQNIENIGKHLKFLIDSFAEITVIVTGSSSFDLMNKSGEPLTGRSYQYTLYPMAYQELKNHFGLIDTQSKLKERLIYGSYPEVLNLTKYEAKENYLKELIQNYLLKDIFMFETIKNSKKIFDLLKLIAYQVGNEVSLDELGRNLNVSKNTVERYLDLLTKVFVLFRIGGFSNNLRKEVVKSSKWYFYDNGIRNAILSDFRDVDNRNDIGQLWENFCIYERIKYKKYQGKSPEYFFWRTYDRQEIDLIEKDNTLISAFEFKWNNMKKINAPAFFAKNYPDVPHTVITNDNWDEFISI